MPEIVELVIVAFVCLRLSAPAKSPPLLPSTEEIHVEPARGAVAVDEIPEFVAVLPVRIVRSRVRLVSWRLTAVPNEALAPVSFRPEIVTGMPASGAEIEMMPEAPPR